MLEVISIENKLIYFNENIEMRTSADFANLIQYRQNYVNKVSSSQHKKYFL